MSQRPRAVLISPLPPTSKGLGLAMRMGLLAEALALRADLTIIVLPVVGGTRAANCFAEDLGAELVELRLSRTPETPYALSLGIKDPAARLAAFRAYGKPSLAAWIGLALRSEIRALLQTINPDVVAIGRAYLAGLAQIVPARARVVLDFDEDDEAAGASIASTLRRRDPAAAAWAIEEGRACLRTVAQVEDRLHAALACSSREAAALRRRFPRLKIDVAMNAVPIPPRRPRRAPRRRELLFVGALAYPPNIHAACWLARRLMPRLRVHAPATTLTLAGARPTKTVRDLARLPGIRVVADPRDIDDLYARTAIAVAPLFQGGGTRLKVLEAAAHGVPLIATRTALQGLAPPRTAFATAPDTAGGFARCLLALLRQTPARRQIGVARAWVSRRHDRRRVIPAWAALCFEDDASTCLASRRDGA